MSEELTTHSYPKVLTDFDADGATDLIVNVSVRPSMSSLDRHKEIRVFRGNNAGGLTPINWRLGGQTETHLEDEILLNVCDYRTTDCPRF